jgi:hypothetical protein
MDIYDKALKFIRAKQIMTMQIRGNDQPCPVHIPSNEFDVVLKNKRQVIDHLINTGQLKRTASKSRNSHEMYLYDAGAGAYDLRLLVKPNQRLTPLELIMRNFLLKTGLQPDAESTMYFNIFLKHKDQVPELFFKVDRFAGRVHTPVCNFHRAYRPYLTIDGKAVSSLDVTTMQPLILGKVLNSVLPGNDFSKWINAGEDIYIKLQTASGLQTRDEGKKRFFEIAFSPPSDALAKAFGNCEWVEWVNWYKRQVEPRNCHNEDKPYSNLAWLLQTTEVSIMRKIWGALAAQKIPFLSVHDEVIIKAKDEPDAAVIMHNVLNNEFEYYKLNSKQSPTQKQTPHPEFTYTIKKESTPMDKAGIVAKFGHSAVIEQSVQPKNDTGSNSPTEGVNDAFTFGWFVSEGKKWFGRSMVKNPVDYYAAFIASYRPTLRKHGIEERQLMDALTL